MKLLRTRHNWRQYKLRRSAANDPFLKLGNDNVARSRGALLTDESIFHQ